MSRLSWALLGLGTVLYVGGKILVHLEALDFRQKEQLGPRLNAQQFLQEMRLLYRAEIVGRAFIGTSLVPFGIAAWRIYRETQDPAPGARPPRQGGHGGF